MRQGKGVLWLTECGRPLPLTLDPPRPFALTCRANGTFDPQDIKWYYNDTLIAPGKSFLHHITGFDPKSDNFELEMYIGRCKKTEKKLWLSHF